MDVKLIILDEADAMTQTAQNALRRIIEKYTQNVRFCIVCNYPLKIIPAVQSRCTKFRFSPLGKDQIISYLNDIIEAERINISQDGMEALIKISCGDMRRVLNILQTCHATNEFIDEDAICNCTGRPNTKDIELIVKTMTYDDYSTAHSSLALQDILTDFCYHLRKSLITDEDLFENIGEIDY
ncbi:21800_t:CDS:2 [Entrophospora sp. SA101]|nr:21800_t:CDS:2 [Entrophospora sp. SA101]